MENLSHISIEGFKSIKKLDLAMNPINVLIGANGSGKSNFISIFTLLDVIYKKNLQTYVGQYGGMESFLHFGSKKTDQIEVELLFGDATNGYRFSLIKNFDDDAPVLQGDAPVLKNDRVFHHYQEKYLDGVWCPISDNSKESQIQDSRDRVANHSKSYLVQCRVHHFHDTPPTAKFKSYQDIERNQFLASSAENLAPFLLRLQQEYEQSYKHIVSAVKTVAPYFKDFDFRIKDEKVLLRWKHVNDSNDLGFSVQALSDGTARFICMATLFLQPKELRAKTIVLDEPEIGLHPDGITVLSEIIKAVSQDDSQVIISTQSVTLANCFEPEDFIVVDYESGESTFTRVDKDKVEDLSAWLEEYQMGTAWEENLLGGMPK